MIKVIIAGSRDFNDFDLLDVKVTEILRDRDEQEIEIISGTARGADTLGEQYALKYGYKLVRYPADWNNYGRRAGYLRNANMARYAIMDSSLGILIAFWDGISRGTKSMIDLATQYGLEVYVVNF